MRARQWYNAVTEYPELVDPAAHPMSHSTKRSFSDFLNDGRA